MRKHKLRANSKWVVLPNKAAHNMHNIWCIKPFLQRQGVWGQKKRWGSDNSPFWIYHSPAQPNKHRNLPKLPHWIIHRKNGEQNNPFLLKEKQIAPLYPCDQCANTTIPREYRYIHTQNLLTIIVYNNREKTRSLAKFHK